MSENEMNVQPLYTHPYYAKDGKLYIEKQSRSGTYLEQLCNFTPRIVSEVTFDDGQTVRKEYRIGGEDEYGDPLPEVDVAADELSKMEWLANHFPATLRLSVVSSVEKHVQYAMKETAVHAEQKYVFAHTGWKEIDGKFRFLLPGCGEHEVRLCGKQKAYCGADTCEQEDVAYLSGFLQINFVPYPVMFPCLALVFLSPLNEFLRRGGCEPKSINLPLLTDIQSLAADGMLMRCMYGYIEWMKVTYLSSEEAVQNFVSALKQKYLSLRTAYREELQNRKIVFHDRLPDTLTCLHIGFDMLLRFLMYRGMLKEDEIHP